MCLEKSVMASATCTATVRGLAPAPESEVPSAQIKIAERVKRTLFAATGLLAMPST